MIPIIVVDISYCAANTAVLLILHFIFGIAIKYKLKLRCTQAWRLQNLPPVPLLMSCVIDFLYFLCVARHNVKISGDYIVLCNTLCHIILV